MDLRLIINESLRYELMIAVTMSQGAHDRHYDRCISDFRDQDSRMLRD